MKLFYLLLSICICISNLHAQDHSSTPSFPKWTLTTNIGSVTMTSRSNSVTEQLSTSFQETFEYNFHLSKNSWYLAVGLSYTEDQLVADGIFTHTGNTWSFNNTPDNFKQQETDLHFIYLPVLLKIRAGDDFLFGVGPYAGYLVKATSTYKIGQDEFTVDAPVQNKYSMGLVLDNDFLIMRRKGGAVFGYGLEYQLTNYLQNARSFKPFSAFFKFGFYFN